MLHPRSRTHKSPGFDLRSTDGRLPGEEEDARSAIAVRASRIQAWSECPRDSASRLRFANHRSVTIPLISARMGVYPLVLDTPATRLAAPVRFDRPLTPRSSSLTCLETCSSSATIPFEERHPYPRMRVAYD